MQVTAIAQPNIALVKYWGKAHEDLIIPVTASISVTLDIFPTTTTVALDSGTNSDSGVLNGRELDAGELDRVTKLLAHVRSLAGSDTFARVTLTNTVPTAAGLASSASGFAALA